MNNNDIIVLIEFRYQNELDCLVTQKTIQRFPIIGNDFDSSSTFRLRIYEWLKSKGFDRKNIYDLRLTCEGMFSG